MIDLNPALQAILTDSLQVELDEFQRTMYRSNINNCYVVNKQGQLTHLALDEIADIKLTDIIECQQLECLRLNDCDISQLPDNIGQLRNLTRLDLRTNQLITLPDSIGQLQNLTRLDLQANQLITLPDSISQLQKLVYLDFNNNQLSTLPVSIGQLQNLVYLNLNNNQLSTLPDSIGKLQNLTRLDINNNQLSTLPDNITQLQNLKELYLLNNQLSILPDNIGQLQNLTCLYIDNNQLSTLPDNITQLQSLKELYLQNNQLSTLPNNIGQLRKLKFLELTNNNFPGNPKELTALSPAEQIRLILTLQQGDTRLFNEAKILVVGNERAGKTSLINRLSGLRHDPNQASTEGINISERQLDNGIKVNIWDFAGQEITHQTHQFFLSNRSLYLYVIDAQKEDDDAGIFHWLSVIQAYGGDNSPIMVIVNQRDKNLGYVFDRQRYQTDFNIVDVLYTCACNKEDIDTDIYHDIEHSIDDLQKRITRRVGELDGIDFLLPANWSKVKNSLQDMQKDNVDYIQKSAYESLCRENKVTDRQDQKTLLKLLNEIGTVVAYPEDRRLNLTQVINPLWVTHAVYKIIRSGKVTDGILSADDIEQILEDDDLYHYKDEHLLWLMKLLNQFELSFSIDEDTLLLPSKLANRQPEFDLSEYKKGLNFRFSYQNLLKKSVIWQLTVKLHHYIDENSNKYWRRGVFLAHEDSKAVVIADENKKVIDIAINNNTRSARELLTIVREGIRTTNGSNLRAFEEVPLIVDDQIVGYEDYDFILDAEKQGQRVLPLRIADPKTGRSISHGFTVNELLDNYRPQKKAEFNYLQLTTDLITIATLETENRQVIFNESEDQTNDRFRTALLHKQYQVADQSRGGESGSGKQAGERDLVIRNNNKEAQSVIEGFILKSCDSQTISSHYDKLNQKYDTTGNARNFILVYAKTKNFSRLWQKYREYCDIHFDGFIDRSEQDSAKGYIKTGLTLFEGREVYHVFVNFYSGPT